MALFRYVFIFLILASCAGEDPDPSEGLLTSSLHFPLEIGHTREYKVQVIEYLNGGAQRDSMEYFMREEIVSEFVDDAGETVTIVDVFTRDGDTEEWSYRESVNERIARNEAIRTENNLKFAKLLFPARNGVTWVGTKYFDASQEVLIGQETIDFFKNWESKYLGINESVEIGGQQYQGVHTVQLADHENRLELRYGKEQYATGIGLIYKELLILDTQCFDNCQDISWEEKAEKGLIWKQTIIDHE